MPSGRLRQLLARPAKRCLLAQSSLLLPISSDGFSRSLLRLMKSFSGF